jgi:2-polyprenyl-6-methoxyphenol hydroxylase-like FAD-dependent oxidoreductase
VYLEKILREKIRDSKYANLQLGAEVTSIEELEGKVRVQYKSQGGRKQQISCTFLVGADGKRGYVRKGYLEAKGIRQEVGV